MVKGIVRPIDGLGRIVIPKELRRSYGLDKDNAVEIYPDGDKLSIRLVKPSCAICDTMDGLIRINDKYICRKCKDSLMNSQ